MRLLALYILRPTLPNHPTDSDLWLRREDKLVSEEGAGQLPLTTSCPLAMWQNLVLPGSERLTLITATASDLPDVQLQELESHRAMGRSERCYWTVEVRALR